MPAVLAAAALAALYLLLDPPSADLAAQTYRVGLFEQHGWLAYDTNWYGGHHPLGYSVLFPPLGALVGLRVAGALALVGATLAFAALPARWFPSSASRHAAGAAFALTTAALLISGRLTFALGVATGTAALAAAARDRVAAAAALGALTALTGPAAALFTALVTGGWWLADRRRRAALAAAAACVAVTGALLALFPQPGTEPFAASAFWPALAATLALLAVAPRAVRVPAALYALLLVTAFAVDTSLGGTATRLGALAGLPLGVALLWRRGAATLALAALPLAYWAVYPAARDWSQAAGDPSVRAGYYAPLLARLAGQTGRLEVVFTARHWEAAHVAPTVPLARGWERRLDRARNPVFYEGALTPARYAAWLRDHAIRWVALPDAALDDSARAEGALVASAPPFLREVWRDAHWRLFAVRRARLLGATLLGRDGFATRGGLVRLAWSPQWAIEEGRGCVQEGPRGWTLVTPRPAGSPVRVGVAVAPARALSAGPRCR